MNLISYLIKYCIIGYLIYQTYISAGYWVAINIGMLWVITEIHICILAEHKKRFDALVAHLLLINVIKTPVEKENEKRKG